MDIHQFDAIRPFEPEELPEVFDRLLQNEQFKQVLAYLYPGVSVEMIGQKMHQCRTNFEFQKAFCYDFLHNLLSKASLGIDFDCQNIDLKRRYTFVSNHRDIVPVSAVLHERQRAAIRVLGATLTLSYTHNVELFVNDKVHEVRKSIGRYTHLTH